MFNIKEFLLFVLAIVLLVATLGILLFAIDGCVNDNKANFNVLSKQDRAEKWLVQTGIKGKVYCYSSVYSCDVIPEDNRPVFNICCPDREDTCHICK